MPGSSGAPCEGHQGARLSSHLGLKLLHTLSVGEGSAGQKAVPAARVSIMAPAGSAGRVAGPRRAGGPGGHGDGSCTCRRALALCLPGLSSEMRPPPSPGATCLIPSNETVDKRVRGPSEPSCAKAGPPQAESGAGLRCTGVRPQVIQPRGRLSGVYLRPGGLVPTQGGGRQAWAWPPPGTQGGVLEGRVSGSGPQMSGGRA